jgi:hypothetical protein
MRCEFCKFYVNEEGQCRVNAPVIGADGMGEWPGVQDFQWCGRFQIDDGMLDCLLALENAADMPGVVVEIRKKIADRKRSK